MNDATTQNASAPRKPCVCISLRRIAQKLTDFYDKALAPAGISINQYSLLRNISRMEGCGTGELARHVRLEKSTLVRTLQPLMRDGLIVDKAPEGTRRRSLFLSPAGRAVLETAIPLWQSAQEEVIARLGPSYEGLLQLSEIIEQWE